jgi:hypothetical protein
MPKRKVDNERTRRYPHLARAIRYMLTAPHIDETKPKIKKGKNVKKK